MSTLEPTHQEAVESVSWNASGTLVATCGRDRFIRIHEFSGKFDSECVAFFWGHSLCYKVISVKWHPHEDVLFSCSNDSTVKIWVDPGVEFDAEKHRRIQKEMEAPVFWHCAQTLDSSCNGHTSTVRALSFNQRGDKMVTCSDDLTLKIWSTNEQSGLAWKYLYTLSGFHDQIIQSVHWSRNDIIATGSGDTIRVFVKDDLDKQLLVSGSEDCAVKIWELVSAS